MEEAGDTTKAKSSWDQGSKDTWEACVKDLLTVMLLWMLSWSEADTVALVVAEGHGWTRETG